MSTANFKSNAGTVFMLPEPTRDDIVWNMHNFAEDNELDESTITDDDIATEREFMAENWREDKESEVELDLQENKNLAVSEEGYHDNDHDYGGRVFAGVTLRKTHSDIIYAEMELMTRSGYYSGMNFDYNVRIYSAYSGEYTDVTDVDEDFIAENLAGYNDRKPSAAQVTATHRALLAEVDRLKKYVEKALTEHTTPLTRVGTFSNGEAVYEKQAVATAGGKRG